MKKAGMSRFIKIALVLIIALLLIFLIIKYKLWHLVEIQYLRKFSNDIKSLGIIGVLAYILIFSIATLFFMPSLPFILFGGITYGNVKGTIYSSIADLLSASLAFFIARYLMRNTIEKALKRKMNYYEIINGVKKEGWRILVVTRMVPIIPRWLQNYAYGLTTISFKIYALVSFICIVPVTAIWIITVNTVGKVQHDTRKLLIYLGIASIVFVTISYIPKLLYKKKLLKK
ncbi:TVP38/TMEM64 family protein [Alkaliphilus pronyensis]|uniref:TVP38/TMEM64 family membrane protein n=1 Tax=Alkaliphilus pronyensis TaxID=1482732 RepID=A0A6I0EZY4_9FIRM|nr:VTT domain-containing protein [Alkaliphilus pronyensis]KAB3534887.1 TVP38/TMEM64 family protein [Alkaliphilus pronyensis]